MAQTQVNIKRLVDNIRKTNIYTPLVEAIANAIDSIEESNRKDGKIIISLIRATQNTLDEGDDLKPIIGIVIKDNGMGFNNKNLEAFNTIYTEQKIRKGGKGFGRFVYLKYFNNVEIESTYNEKGSFVKKSFKFVKDNIIIQDEKNEKSEETENLTLVKLQDLKRDYKLEKKIETISRKLLEKLLVYFVLDDYKCPQIIVEDDVQKIVLNDYLGENKEVVEVEQKEFILESSDKSARETFKSKVFKIFYGESRSSVNLVADHRQVTEEALHCYIPEFRGDFIDEIENSKGKKIAKNFTIKTYVTGRYLDNNVSTERDGFHFQENGDLFFPFSKNEIEQEATNMVKDVFKDEITTRQQKKEFSIKKYVDEEAPWHKSYVGELDLAKIAYGVDKSEMENELQKLKYQKETQARIEITKILKNNNEEEISQKTEEIVKKISEVGRSDLVHYVALRRTILDLFKKSLQWDDSKKYQKEKVIHDIIFPTKKDSDSLPYNEHNLWILDEKLSFTEYLISDKPLNVKDRRPDLVVFDNRISVRAGDEASNPIIVFEFKKPQRTTYGPDENPLKQITNYIKQIRDGDFKKPDGRDIYITENTPAYGFLVCDLNKQINSFCEDYGLTKSPDNKGYFGFHPNHKIYFEVISFDKLVNDSELRNKIFFKKVGLI